MIRNYEKENENLQSQIEYLQKQIEENKKAYEEEKAKEEALKKEICEAFNIQNPNANVWRYIFHGYFFYTVDTSYIAVEENIDVSNVSKKYKNAKVLTHFIYQFEDGRKVDFLPLLFDKNELMSGFGIYYDLVDKSAISSEDKISFYNLDTRDVIKVSVYKDYKKGQLVIRKEKVIREHKSDEWETIKKFDENKIIIDPDNGIKVFETINKKLLDNQLVR